MSQKTVLIEGVGPVILAKRRGSRHLRLSVTARGQVRVGMPTWTPYAAGVAFAKSRADWIAEHLSDHQPVVFKDGDAIGKSHRLYYQYSPGAETRVRVAPNQLQVKSPLPLLDPAVQAKVVPAAEKILKKQSDVLLPQRLAELAGRFGFSYSSVKVRKLTSRWGSCNSKKEITLSYFLIQLPWDLIDYVLLHELTHTEHMNHSKEFWSRFEQVLPGARKLRKRVHEYKPTVTVG